MTAEVDPSKHHWLEVTFVHDRRIQCFCGYIPESQADMDAHIPSETLDMEALQVLNTLDASETFKLLIAGLEKQFGRMPTEEEVIYFISSSNEERMNLWNNKGLPTNDAEEKKQ